ncbi:MAG: DUF4912 domain-containing protein [Trichodesmium sp. ALOHA_ZT_67]|nr:DUF4912 domain-containing protein [Trichodesmium sp. ALOHA_ZT_67]
MVQERPPLEEMTLRQLRKVASELGISRYSRMRKAQLLAAVIEAQGMNNLSSAPLSKLEVQERAEAKKFESGEENNIDDFFSSVDEGLTDLPNGYAKSKIVLMPRDPEWAYAYWDISNELKEELRSQGGQQLALRTYDVTDINLDSQSPHSIQEYPCDELAREWYIPIPVSDRNYTVEIGYRCADGRWLVLSRSEEVNIPPVYPSDWIDEQFITVSWDEDLRGKTFMELFPASRQITFHDNHDDIYQGMFGIAEAEDKRVSGSMFGSVQMVPGSGQMIEQTLSSYAMVSGLGMWASGSNVSCGNQMMSGVGQTMSGVGLNASGVGLTASGVGLTASGMGMNMSGVGLTASGMGMNMSGIAGSIPPIRPRKFWLVADAELIIHGATEPDATVTIGGRPIKLNPDGTFRFQMAFPDGLIDYPIMAVAVDGEQNRSIHMQFTRETPERHTNKKEEAILEWMS